MNLNLRDVILSSPTSGSSSTGPADKDPVQHEWTFLGVCHVLPQIGFTIVPFFKEGLKLNSTWTCKTRLDSRFRFGAWNVLI